MKKLLVIILLAIAILATASLLPDYRHVFSLEWLKSSHEHLLHTVRQQPLLSGFIYTGLYIIITAVSIPGAVFLTLAGGALFGLFWGCILVSVASTVGATLAFLVVRYLCRDWVQSRFADAWNRVSDGFSRDGAYYLFSLRLVPVVPFFLVNILMALTNIRTGVYFVVSQLGMLPATLVYVYAGTELSKIRAVEDILSPGLLLAFVMIASFPWLARYALSHFKVK